LRVPEPESSFEVFTGRVVPEDSAGVSAKLPGYIKRVLVDEGDYVKKGQLVVVIDPVNMKEEINSAENALNRAREMYEAAVSEYDLASKRYERYKRLLSDGAVSRDEFDEIEAMFKAARSKLGAARASVEIAKARLRSLKSELSYFEIRAPFEGRVASVDVDPGDLAKPGDRLLQIYRPPYYVEVRLPERMMNKVAVGSRIKVNIETLGITTHATVTEIEPAVNPETRTFGVKAKLPGEQFVVGLMAKVYFKKHDGMRLMVPASSIYKKWDFTGVWVVERGDILRLRFVKLGERYGEMVEVISGLEPGERILVDGLEKACDGCKVGGY